MEKPLLPSTNRAASPKGSSMPRTSPALILGAALTPFLSACSSPDSEPSAETSTTSSTTSSSSATSSSSTASSATTSSSEESMSEEPANSVAPEPETQAQAAVAEPELLYCDPGNLTILGTFSDGTQRPTDLCDTPAHRRAARAEGVCGNPSGRYEFPEEYAELCHYDPPEYQSDGSDWSNSPNESIPGYDSPETTTFSGAAESESPEY